MWSLEKVKTDLLDFHGPKNDSNYLDVELKVLRRDNNRDFRLVQDFRLGEADFNRFIRLTNPLVIAAENFGEEENFSPALIPTMSKDINQQLKLAHKFIDGVDEANRMICVTLLRYIVENLKNSYAQVRFFSKKKERKKFQQIVSVKYKLERVIYQLEVMDAVYGRVTTTKPICNVL